MKAVMKTSKAKEISSDSESDTDDKKPLQHVLKKAMKVATSPGSPTPKKGVTKHMSAISMANRWKEGPQSTQVSNVCVNMCT